MSPMLPVYSVTYVPGCSDSLPDLDTSGLCLVKTLSTALTCWPFRNTALRDGARTSTRTSSVAKGRMASIHCRPAPPNDGKSSDELRERRSRHCGRPGWPLDLNDVDGSDRVIHRGMIRGRLAQLRAWILPAWADSGFDREVRSVVRGRPA